MATAVHPPASLHCRIRFCPSLSFWGSLFLTFFHRNDVACSAIRSLEANEHGWSSVFKCTPEHLTYRQSLKNLVRFHASNLRILYIIFLWPGMREQIREANWTRITKHTVSFLFYFQLGICNLFERGPPQNPCNFRVLRSANIRGNRNFLHR